MKRMKKLMVSILLVGILLFTAACNASFDAAGYVKSCLDLLTRCEYKEYITFTERTKEEAVADYEKSMDSMMSEYESLGLSEELVEKYRKFFEDLYRATKYEVLEAVQNEDGSYLVEVEVEQVTGVFNGVTDALNAAAISYGEEIAASGEEISDEAINEWIYNKLYEIVSANLANVTYKEKQIVTVTVALEGELYNISDADYAALDEALIDLGDMTY